MKPEIVSFGELLIDFVALERDVSVGYAQRFEKAGGGAPANVAVGLAKLGIPTAFMTQLGEDPFGHFLCDTLQDNGVDTTGITFTKEARTALAFVSVEASGERSFAFYRHPSADMLMTPDALDRPMIEQAKIFHFGSITLIDDPVRRTTMTALDVATSGGALISYDPNLRPMLWPSLARARDGMMEGLRRSHIVKMNEEELSFLSGQSNLTDAQAISSAARRLWHDGLQLMIITRGQAGCIAVTPNAHWSAPVYPVQVEDTIGAGDGFMAGLLAGIHARSLAAFDSEAAVMPLLRQANAVGALTATQRGGIPALPDAATVRQFLQAQAAWPTEV